MTTRIDINCDLGESFGRYELGNDAAMLRLITSANVACGLHAGDPVVMRQTVEQAAHYGVAIGAHPGYPDLQGFGRRAMQLAPAELEAYIIYQLGALAGFTQAAGTSLVHVKPHGALYNDAARDNDIAAAVVRAIAAFDANLIVMALSGSALELAARSQGLRVAREGFADRAYQPDGTLLPRSHPAALILDPAEAAARAVRIVTRSEVDTIYQKTLPLRVDTLCVHGDTPSAPKIAAQLRTALKKAGVVLASLSEVLPA